MSNRRPLRPIPGRLTRTTTISLPRQPTKLLRLGVPGQASIFQQPSNAKLEQLLRLYTQVPQVKSETIFKHALNNVEMSNPFITKTYVIDGVGAVITTGVKYPGLKIDFNCDIKEVSLYADQPGSCVTDLWKDAWGNYPPTNADSITSATPPTLAAAQTYLDTTLTGWITTVNAGDVILPNVDSASTITLLAISFKLLRRS